MLQSLSTGGGKSYKQTVTGDDEEDERLKDAEEDEGRDDDETGEVGIRLINDEEEADFVQEVIQLAG
ncbi:hypothetical protein P8452_41454 [Trifolium repens]|nr:hypothetical protein P8452_41454 [Trifolium repens]